MRSKSIVRITDARGKKEFGVGFLVSPRHLMTCAHVVADGLNSSEAAYSLDKPVGEVTIDFPFVTPTSLTKAKIVKWFPIRERDDDAPESACSDIAVLELTDSAPVESQSVRAVQIVDWGNQIFRAYGFATKKGTYARGVFTGEVRGGWIEVRSSDDAVDFVRPGFSGAPAWLGESSQTVGMVVAISGRTNAYVIPVSVLRNAWPLITTDPLPRLKLTDSDYELICRVNRYKQVNRLKGELETIMRTRTAPLILCLAHGDTREDHDSLLRRLRTDAFRDIAALDGSYSGINPIDFHNSEGFRLEDRLRDLCEQLGRWVKESDIVPDKIAAALNQAGAPKSFCVNLYSDAFGRREAGTLRHWVQYLRRVADCGLKMPVIVIFDVHNYRRNQELFGFILTLIRGKSIIRRVRRCATDWLFATHRRATGEPKVRLIVLDELKPLSLVEIELWIISDAAPARLGYLESHRTILRSRLHALVEELNKNPNRITMQDFILEIAGPTLAGGFP
jgi:hypothetical protein